MQTHSDPPSKGAPVRRVDRRVIGGITLYPIHLAKIDNLARTQGISRSAAFRLLIDMHL